MSSSLDQKAVAESRGRPVEMPAHATNPYVFLVGCPRSGTTMLKRMVDAHRMIRISRETHWIPKIYERRRGMNAEGHITVKTIDKLFEHHRFQQMKMSRQALVDFLNTHSNATYAELVSHVFNNYARHRHKPLAGDKTPTYVRRLPTLWELWPQTRIVHIVRDGRNVWLSMRNWRMAHKAVGQFCTWKEAPVVTTALWWKALVGRGMEDGRLLGAGRYLELAYESLVDAAVECCQNIATFLAVPYDPAMPRYFEGRNQARDGASANANWLPPTPGLRDWRRSMPAQEQQQFEWAAGDMLRNLGYQTTAPDPTPALVARLAGIKRRFANQVLERGWELPEGW